ncbi:MAG: glycosyltransferase family 9 protein [Chlorobium phaeobacteroides]|uniref:Glycosyl transferase family 9 n=1 Tax=Chlorobium phaeobacteroides (strain BS1) TaxID=331678 RepID=B3EKF7_CHLPB|nr:glycosyltransferase family 9 protein [Chlorobium phaeobacteroides]MBL6956547.1 glycosyltransferase family 9 protein [Chlorobium phaeobacteroides]
MALRPEKNQEIGKILVIRLSSIGDIVLTTPVLRRLRAAYPDAVIDYCIKPPFASLLNASPYLNTVYTTASPPDGHYDMVVDLQNNLRSRKILKNISCDAVCRYHKMNWKKLLLVRTGLNLFRAPDSVVERYMASIPWNGKGCDGMGCELWLSEDDRGFAASFNAGDEYRLAVCFGANHLTKRYPPLRFASIIELLGRRHRLQFFLLGGTEDVRHAEEIIAALSSGTASSVVNLAGKTSLTRSAAVLESCDAVLSNDTGLMHVASSFGKQLFVLFGSSVAEFGFLPYNAPYSLFEVRNLSCRPCSHIGRDRCPKGHFRCMMDISETSVSEKISDYFKKENLKRDSL